MPNLKLPITDPHAALMRAACPLPGTDFDKLMRVILGPGEGVDRHAHKRHAVLYYPEPASTVLIEPQAGTMLYLPPGTVHSVHPVKIARLSLAMLISP